MSTVEVETDLAAGTIYSEVCMSRTANRAHNFVVDSCSGSVALLLKRKTPIKDNSPLGAELRLCQSVKSVSEALLILAPNKITIP